MSATSTTCSSCTLLSKSSAAAIGSYWKCTSLKPTWRAAVSKRGLGLRVARRIVVDEEHRAAEHGALDRLTGLRFGARSSGA